MRGGSLYQCDVAITPDNCPQDVNRKVIKEMIQSHPGIFGNRKPVFDGRKNMYAAVPLVSDWVNLQVTLPSVGRARLFWVSIKPVGQVDLQNLKDAVMYRSCSIPMVAVQALDVILRQLPSMTLGPVLFTAHLAASLGGGRKAWHGHYQSVQLCEREVTLNVDVSATAFYKAQPVTEFMCEVLRLRDVTIRYRLPESQRVELAKEITGLKVVVTHGDTRRWYRVRDVTRKAVRRQTFPWQLENGETVHCTVAEYFLRRYGIEL
ncbi:hypothetical protein MTO96_037970, partial [Rhipicephalus appendiculatus]